MSSARHSHGGRSRGQGPSAHRRVARSTDRSIAGNLFLSRADEVEEVERHLLDAMEETDARNGRGRAQRHVREWRGAAVDEQLFLQATTTIDQQLADDLPSQCRCSALFSDYRCPAKGGLAAASRRVSISNQASRPACGRVPNPPLASASRSSRRRSASARQGHALPRQRGRESRRKWSTGASAIALTRSLTNTWPAAGNLAIRLAGSHRRCQHSSRLLRPQRGCRLLQVGATGRSSAISIHQITGGDPVAPADMSVDTLSKGARSCPLQSRTR